MSTNDHGRKEPSLADLEAFEKLLSQTLHDTPVPAPAAPKLSSADQSAMAELTRLIEQPLDFAMPTIPLAPRAAEPVMIEPPQPAPQPVEQPAAEPLETHAHFETGFSPDWPPATSRVALPHTPEPVVEPPQTPVLDPLAAFEEELRRFDASRLAIPETPAPLPEPPPLPVAVQAMEEHAFDHQALVERQRQEEAMFAAPAVAEPPPYVEPLPPQPSALELAEQRLADEAAAASYGDGPEQVSDVKRSKGVFMALGGLAVAGLAVIGGTFLFSGERKSGGSGDVPVIAAKREPTKEKPADPGGVEIPNQDAKVLAGREATQESVPAKQVVNTTEQPMDLREVTRRESVRVIAPNPYQQGTPTPTAESPAAVGTPRPAEVEQRRVTSVRVPVGGESSAAPSNGPGAAALAAGAAGAAAIASVTASRAAPKAESPKADSPKPAPKAETPAPRKVEAKVGEARSETAKATPKATPTPKEANASATPKVKAPEKKAPMPLTGDGKAKATPAAAGGSGTYAVQLASRPTEADARSAASSLGSKFSAQLGGKAARVVSGEANGQKVYRVRAGGYSQTGATEACNRIKAAGGNCFIAKQ